MRSSRRATTAPAFPQRRVSRRRSSPASDRTPWRAVRVKRRDDFLRHAHPTENTALRLDHLQPHVVKFRKVGCTAVGEHDAPVTAIVGFAYGGVDADFGGDAADEK